MNWQRATETPHFSPLSIGVIHFIGIGGIGMSGIAEILHNLGYKVQGSDLTDNANVKRLRDKGLKISIGHRAENLGAANVVVVSSAVKKDNPELVAAKAAALPIVRRAEMLGELMRLKWSVAVGGTHGKTTTTSMVASLFDTAGLDPTVVNGGIINAYGSNARLGAGEWMVVESDESDGSFTKLPATIAIVTNIDPEHMDHYPDFDAVRAAYDSFVQNIPFYGFAVLCADHPEVQALAARINDRKLITYGFSPQADLRAINVEAKPEGTRFDIVFTNRKTNTTRTIEGFFLPVIGQHNVLNSLAAIATGIQLGFADHVLRTAFSKFEGVKRRFTRTGLVNGVTIVDDYGHHPVEIAATLKAGQQAKGDKGKIIAVMQPHRYTRLSGLFKDFCTCFNDADIVIIADVYPAGEQPIEGVHRDALVEGLRAHGHREVHGLKDLKDLAPLIASLATPGDYVICLGAGSISAWAHALPGELELLPDAAAKEKARVMIHIGIIETGHPADAIIERYGSYPHMFRDYFADRADMDFYSFSVLENEPLPSAKKCDGWLITGSKAAVYENHPWLQPLSHLVQEANALKIPMLGICFGHQIMAQAMGGVVEKWPQGRGIGVHQYTLTAEGEKLMPGKKTFNLLAAHQDQVTKPPPTARLLATSAFCQYAGFAYGLCGLSLQGHPEFSVDYERDLIIQWQQRDPAEPSIVEKAMKSLDTLVPDLKSLAPILGRFLARETVI